MSPPLSAASGLSGGLARVVVEHGHQLAIHMAVVGLSLAAVVISFVRCGVVAIRRFFTGWASAPRPKSGPLPRVVAAGVRTIDAFERALSRIVGSVGCTIGVFESPLGNAIVKLESRIATLVDRG